jgi:hypothetical protein
MEEFTIPTFFKFCDLHHNAQGKYIQKTIKNQPPHRIKQAQTLC